MRVFGGDRCRSPYDAHVGRIASLVVASWSLLAACGGEAAKGGAATPKVRAMSGSTFESYFPLEDGNIFHYVTHDGTDTGMLVAKVVRKDATHGELRLSNAAKRFVFTPDGVAYDGGPYILKGPIDVGTSWPGEHGGTTKIVAVDVVADVPEGHHASCVRTVEEGGRPEGSRYETTYCPGVGMVLLVVSAGGASARAELKSHGPPMKIQ